MKSYLIVGLYYSPGCCYDSGLETVNIVSCSSREIADDVSNRLNQLVTYNTELDNEPTKQFIDSFREQYPITIPCLIWDKPEVDPELRRFIGMKDMPERAKILQKEHLKKIEDW